MIDILADYKDSAGCDRHQAFKTSAPDKMTAALAVLYELRAKGNQPTGIFYIHGDNSLDVLKQAATSVEVFRSLQVDPLWVDLDEVERTAALLYGRRTP